MLRDILARDKNNFDIVRLFAALLVIFGHSFYLFPTGGYSEPVTLIVKNNYSGTLAVGIFFFLSGILVTQSYNRNNSVSRFLLMRSARIYPGLIVCVLLTTFIIGAFVTNLSAADYIGNTGVYCYLVTNLTQLSFVFPSLSCIQLPGAFADNRIPLAVNGSLWTLPTELVCYIYVLAAGLLGVLRSRIRIIFALLLILIIYKINPLLVPYFSDDHYTDKLKMGLFFMAGVFFYALRDVIKIKHRYMLALIAVAVPLQFTIIHEYALYLAIFYTVIVMSAPKTLPRIVMPGDYSFGVYIYGWPIQQAMAHFFPSLTSYPSNLITMPLALMAAYLSWTYVESPFLAFANRGAEAFARRWPAPQSGWVANCSTFCVAHLASIKRSGARLAHAFSRRGRGG